MITMGLLFYLNPALQMAWGVLIGHEPMPVGRWVGFGLIWVALAVMTASSLGRKSAAPGAEGVETAASESSSR